MFIKSISLKNFKKFSDVVVNLTSDISIIRGPNEQGKSTLLAAFLAGFFYDPKKNNKEIQELKAWNSDKMYEISILIEHNGEEIELYKNFETGEAYLENKTRVDKLTTHNQISDYLYTIGALRSPALFRHTACVEHDALAKIAEGKKDISQALSGLITSSQENISADKILKKISEIIVDLQRGTRSQAKNPGLIKQLSSEVAELNEKRRKIKEELSQNSVKTAQLGVLKDELDRINNEFEIKKKQYEKNQQYFKTSEGLKNLHSQLLKVNSDFEVLKDVSDKKKYLYFQLNKMSALQSFDWERFSQQKETLAVKKEKIRHFQSEATLMKKEKKSSAYHLKKSYLAVVLVFFALGFLGFIDSRLFSFFGLFFAAFIYSFIFKKGLVIHTGAAVAQETGGLLHEVAVIESQIEKMFKENGVADEGELIEKVKLYNKYGSELARLESKEEGVLRGMNFDEFVKQRDELLKNVAIEESKISSDEEKVNPPGPETQRSLEIDMQKYQKEIDRLRKEIAEISALVKSLHIDQEALVKVEEEAEYKERKKIAAERKLKTMEYLHGAMEEAQQKTIAHLRSHLEDYMRKYLPVITDGRYHNVRIKDDLSFEVWSEDKKDMIVPEDHLSKGTIDQFYLIARFALLDILNKGVKSLILLDDPFSGFDAGRKERAREILTDLTSAFQIIIFTHSPEYDSWGKVIEI